MNDEWKALISSLILSDKDRSRLQAQVDRDHVDRAKMKRAIVGMLDGLRITPGDRGETLLKYVDQLSKIVGVSNPFKSASAQPNITRSMTHNEWAIIRPDGTREPQ